MNLRKYLNKKAIISLLVSTAVVLVCFAIIIFRFFNPYHRWVAVILYLASWLLFVYPFLHRKNLKRIKNNPHFRFLKKHIIAIAGYLFFGIILYSLFAIVPLDSWNLSDEDIASMKSKIPDDMESVSRMIVSLDDSYSKLDSSGLLMLSIEDANPEKTAELKSLFKQIVENIVILEQYMDKYKYFYRIEDSDLKAKAFLMAYAPYIAKYRVVFEMTKDIDDNDYVEGLLNEELGKLGSEVYLKLKTGYSNPYTMIRINAGRAYIETLSLDEPLKDYSVDAYDEMFGGFDHTLGLSVDNAFDVFERRTMEEWLPVQKGVSNFLGETRISARHGYFITDAQIKNISYLLEPGDIMFQRRNWYISNAGMPGFWTHAALYVGTLDQLDSYFSDDAQELLNMNLSEYIKINYPEVYADKSNKFDGQYLTTIEGKAAGVIMLPIEVSAKADYLAFIRPRLSKKEKLKALLFAFGNYKKPYDYDFDFSTDDSLVCSELVYKAYLPDSRKNGLTYNISTIAGRWMLAPNDMVRAFDERYGTEEQQNDFVLFLDGNEKLQRAEFRHVDEFRESWKRPKYGFFLD